MRGYGDGVIFADGKSLVFGWCDHLFRADNPFIREFSLRREASLFHTEVTLDIRVDCQGFSRCDQVSSLKEIAAQLSVAELFDIINEKLEFRGVQG